MDTLFALQKMQSSPCVSGREFSLSAFLCAEYASGFDEAGTDSAGNCFFYKKGKKENLPTVLLEAHMDEVGVCVKELWEGGFVSIEPCGGLDTAILPGTEFFIFGKKTCRAIATAKPPHLLSAEEQKEKLKIENIYLDTGFKTLEEMKEVLSVGDVAHYAAEPKSLNGGFLTARGLDNKAGVLAVLNAAQKISCEKCNLLVLLSAGEETTSIGVKSLCRKRKPDFAIVVDVGFAYGPGLERSKCIEMKKGPSVSITDTLSRKMSNWVLDTAKEFSLPCQVICEPGGTGTSATAIQVIDGGIPSCVISIPLKNMHTPSEIVYVGDIEKTSELLIALCEKANFEYGEVDFLGNTGL